MEGRLELRAVVGLDPLDVERELLEHVVDEPDRAPLAELVGSPAVPARTEVLRTAVLAARPSPASRYIASKVSQTSIVAPPWSTGQPWASLTAASRLSALMRL